MLVLCKRHENLNGDGVKSVRTAPCRFSVKLHIICPCAEPLVICCLCSGNTARCLSRLGAMLGVFLSLEVLVKRYLGFLVHFNGSKKQETNSASS